MRFGIHLPQAGPAASPASIQAAARQAEALGFHLQTTAGGHFPQLLAIAVPGPFFFFGDVPEELKAATQQMGLGAEFGTHVAGFDR